MPLQLCFSWNCCISRCIFLHRFLTPSYTFVTRQSLYHEGQLSRVSHPMMVRCVPYDGIVWRYVWWGTIWGGTNTQSMVYDSWLPGIWLNHTLCWHGIVWFGAILRCLLWYYNLSWSSFSVWSAVKHCRLYGVWQSLKHLIVKYMVGCVCCVW